MTAGQEPEGDTGSEASLAGWHSACRLPGEVACQHTALCLFLFTSSMATAMLAQLAVAALSGLPLRESATLSGGQHCIELHCPSVVITAV